MTLPTTYADGNTIHAADLNAWDTAINALTNTLTPGFTTTVTSSSPVTLVNTSSSVQVFTGSTAQTVLLPTTGVVAGCIGFIINNSSAAITVQSSGANTINIVAAGTVAMFTALVVTPTTAANWRCTYWGQVVVSGKSLTVNKTLTLDGTDGTTMTFPATSSNVLTSVTGVAPVTGTPGSTNYLRGDGAWGVPSGLSITTANSSTLPVTMTIGSSQVQVFTGSTVGTVTLPTTSITAGYQVLVINQSSAVITVQSSGAATVVALAAGTSAVLTAGIATPVNAADWDVQYGGVVVTSGKVLTVSNTMTLSGPDGAALALDAGGGIPNTLLPDGVYSNNTATQSQIVVSATAYYVTSSALSVPASPKNGIVVGTVFRWRIAMAKTAAGTGSFQIVIYRGTNGSTADTADVSQSIGTQTAVADAMSVDIQVVVTTSGATGAYSWSIVPSTRNATAIGFGVPIGATGQFSGTKSSVALNTANLKFGIGFIATTGTPTITIPQVQAEAYGLD